MSLIYSEEKKKAIILNLFFFPFSSSYKKRRKGKAASEVQHLWQAHCLITCSFHPLEGGELVGRWQPAVFGVMAPVAPQIMPGLGYFLSHPSLDLLCSRISELWVHFPREKQSHSCYGVLWVSLNSARTGRKSGISQCWSTTAGWEHSSKKVCD